MRAWAAILTSLILLTPEPGAIAQQASLSGVSLAFDVVSPSSLHEPVLLYVVVRNDSSKRVLIDLGRNRVGNTLITITGRNAQRVKIDERHTGGLSVRGTAYVEPNQSLEHEIVLNRWADFGAIGSYTIQTDFIGRIESSDGRPITVQRHWTKELIVTARDEQVLRATCEELTREIESTDDAECDVRGIDT
jgi:hypothetical protein